MKHKCKCCSLDNVCARYMFVGVKTSIKNSFARIYIIRNCSVLNKLTLYLKQKKVKKHGKVQ